MLVKLTHTGRHWIPVEHKHRANGFMVVSCEEGRNQIREEGETSGKGEKGRKQYKQSRPTLL